MLRSDGTMKGGRGDSVEFVESRYDFANRQAATQNEEDKQKLFESIRTKRRLTSATQASAASLTNSAGPSSSASCPLLE